MVLLLLALLPLALAAPNPDSHIVNGNEVDIADYPWQGSYRRASGSHTCGCVFVSGKYVLTAAHCGGDASFTMEFGGSNRGSGTVFSIDKVLRHPNYDNGSGFTPNDISIVYANEAISGTNISPARIPPTNTNPGGMGMITGWGRTCGDCSIPVALLGRSINIITDNDCSSRWGNSFQSSSMICVYDGQGGACSGDSGGPLTVSSVVHGLASWVATGCLSNYPSTYARVGAFRTWVCENTEDGVNGC